MGVLQSGHSGFSLHHSMMQFLFILSKFYLFIIKKKKRVNLNEDEVERKKKERELVMMKEKVPAEYMATRCGCWVLAITQTQRAFAYSTACIRLHNKVACLFNIFSFIFYQFQLINYKLFIPNEIGQFDPLQKVSNRLLKFVLQILYMSSRLFITFHFEFYYVSSLFVSNKTTNFQFCIQHILQF